MNKTLALVAALGLSMLVRAADAPVPPPVVYMDAAKVSEALAKTGLITNNNEYSRWQVRIS